MALNNTLKTVKIKILRIAKPKKAQFLNFYETQG